MAAQCQGEPRGLGSRKASAMGHLSTQAGEGGALPTALQGSGAAVPQLFFLFQWAAQWFCHCTLQISVTWPKSLQGQYNLIPRKGWEGKSAQKQRHLQNCIAETFNPKRCIFSQETVTHDLIFPGYKTSKWFIWPVKKKSYHFSFWGKG